MSNYTPTTEEVRFRYSRNVRTTTAVSVAEFDRWLAEVKEAERKTERERIRANIIDRVNDLMSCHKDDNCGEIGSSIESYIQEWLDD